jgi:hypothetical protein
MDVELLVVPDCPNESAARQLLRTALDDIGLARVDFRVTVIADRGDAERRGFHGSPSFLVDGADLFAEDATPETGMLACRIYRSSLEGVSGVPTLRDLRRELKRAAHRALIQVS